MEKWRKDSRPGIVHLLESRRVRVELESIAWVTRRGEAVSQRRVEVRLRSEREDNTGRVGLGGAGPMVRTSSLTERRTEQLIAETDLMLPRVRLVVWPPEMVPFMAARMIVVLIMLVEWKLTSSRKTVR